MLFSGVPEGWSEGLVRVPQRPQAGTDSAGCAFLYSPELRPGDSALVDSGGQDPALCFSVLCLWVRSRPVRPSVLPPPRSSPATRAGNRVHPALPLLP